MHPILIDIFTQFLLNFNSNSTEKRLQKSLLCLQIFQWHQSSDKLVQLNFENSCTQFSLQTNFTSDENHDS